MSDNNQNQKSRLTPGSFIFSLFAAWFGVQSKANRDRDFEHGKFSHFIIGGIVFVVLFVLVVVGIVQIVMSTAGA